jgi:hypothetical protein
MQKHLKKLLLLFAILSIPAGFFVEPEHAIYGWQSLPSLDAIVGGVGVLLLLLAIKGVAYIASRKEDFYD